MTSLRDPASSGGAFFNIADHALAGVASHDARTAIRARLPWRARVGMRYIATGAVVLMAALAVGGAAWFLEVPVARHEAEHFFATTDSSGTHHARAVRISPVGWTADRPLDVTTGRAIAPWPSFAASDVTMRPGSRAIVGHREYPDSGAVDVTLWMPDGREQRLTAARGDDVPSGWAPDGSALLIESSREGRRGHRAIYAIVPETGRLRRISSGGADGSSDTDASWSPDGSRIAFTRQYFALRPDELCLVDSDGRHERCRGFAGHSVVRLGGWLDARRLMITTDSVGAERVGIVHVDAWTMAWTPLVGDCRVSPDTRWVACSTGMELHIAPMSDLSATSRVIAGTPDRVVTPVWNVSSKPRLPIGSLTIVPPRSEVLVGAPTRLRAVAMTTGGQALDGITLRWSMLDSTQGQLTPEGVLTAARAGAIRIAVTAGGWRTTDTTVHAVARDGDVLLRERWEDSVSQRWRYFGVPTPTTVDVNGAKAFWNRGEGTYYSGAYLRSASPAALGIWVEARVATPLTATQWQVLSLNMVGLRDRRLLDRWDHATGYLPLRHDLCHFTYPRGEGMRNIDRFSPAGYVSEVLPYPSDSLRSGAWYTVLLQVLPDGRCGVAINGIPVHVSTTGGPVPDSAIVLTQGSSDGTRILLGPLTIGRGVRLDVPWAQAGRFGRSSMSSTNVMRGVPRGQPR